MKKSMLLSAIIFSLALAVTSAFAQNAQESILGLINAVKIIPFSNYGNQNSLLVKLENAQASLNSGNYKAAVNKLHAFKNEVNVLDSIFAKRGLQFPSSFLQNEADYTISTINSTTVANVGATGGMLQVTDSTSPIIGTSLSIPQAALTTEALVTITPDATPPSLPSNITAAGPAVNFGPEGLKFNAPVTIKIPYTSNRAGMIEENLKLFTMSEGVDAWEAVPNFTIDNVNRIISAQVSHFSTFQVGEASEDTSAPIINWIRVWNETYESNTKGVTLLVSVTDPNGPNSHVPDNIDSLKVTGPGFYYEFIKGDYWYNNFLNNAFYAKSLPLNDYLVSGEYIFTVKDIEGKESSMTKNLVLNPVPVVDPNSVQIYDYTNGTWKSADNFEGVQRDKDLKMRWTSVPGYWYRVYIENWQSSLIYHGTLYLNPTEITIPFDVLYPILLDNASYRVRLEGFDYGDGYLISHRSRTHQFQFTTGDLKFSSTLLISAYPLITNYQFPGARYCIGVTTLGQNDYTYIGVKRPLETDFIDITTMPGFSRGSFKVWDSNINGYANRYYNWVEQSFSNINNIQKGEYIFKAKDSGGREVYLKDYFNEPSLMPIPDVNSLSPFGNEVPGGSEFFVNTLSPQFQWAFLTHAKTYEIQLQQVNFTPPNNIAVVESFLVTGITALNYTFPTELLDGGRYRWRLRAADGGIGGYIDNKSVTGWRYFAVQQ